MPIHQREGSATPTKHTHTTRRLPTTSVIFQVSTLKSECCTFFAHLCLAAPRDSRDTSGSVEVQTILRAVMSESIGERHASACRYKKRGIGGLTPLRSPDSFPAASAYASAPWPAASEPGDFLMRYSNSSPILPLHLGHLALAMPLPLAPPSLFFLRPSSLITAVHDLQR